MQKLLSFILLLFCSINLFAQTSGPSQPEVQSFQPVSMTNMVQPSTGEFQYQIPLFSIGGYPININYNSQVGMENEASLVGLGWNLNVGAITRQVRGIPDDFLGDVIRKKVSIKPNITIGMKTGVALEIVGFDKSKLKIMDTLGVGLKASSGLFYNNYNGWGVESSIGVGMHGNIGGLSGNAGIGINSNSQHGTNINPYAGISYSINSALKNKNAKYREGTEHKKDISSRLNIIGASIDFNRITYSPQQELPFKTTNLDFTYKGGSAAFYTEFGGEFNGYLIKQKLEVNELNNPSFGYFYADSGKDSLNALMDFNRESDGVMTEDKPNLPFSFATQDIFSAVGQGLGTVFEIKRNNVFMGFDAEMKNRSNSFGGELDFGQATGTHAGAEFRYGNVVNRTGKWTTNNFLLLQLDFVTPTGDLAEKTYFKNPSDVMFNQPLGSALSGFSPIAPVVKRYWGIPGIEFGKLMVGNSESAFTSNQTTNKNRDNRLDAIYYLKGGEAKNFGLQKAIQSYTLNNFTTAPAQIPRVGDVRKEHHLSELTCLKSDGSKYIFNIPAYNNSKKETYFSINDNLVSGDYTTDTTYSHAIDKHKGGKDDFISITETPGFAHSYLLGNVLSPNYIDVNENGPDEQDKGDYVKFNYSRVFENYYWRNNNNISKATAEKGHLSDDRDAKGFVTEGTKEVWLIHSIESKNEVARFYYSDRTDAYDLKNTSQKLKKLDSVLVFSVPELKNNPLPKPIKRVYFSFDNQLCKGIYGNPNLGKLTLKKVYFKDGISNKGKHSAYEFDYSSTNPSYNTLNTDRWGNYKPNPNTAIQLDNHLFPFSDQDKTSADNYSSAWLMNKIKLPSGGSIIVDYESHDYAFVQDKKAMVMTKVIGFSQNEPTQADVNSPSNELYKNISGSWNDNNYLIFKLKEPMSGVSPAIAAQKIRELYLTDGDDNKYGSIINNPHSNLYGKFRVNIKNGFGTGEEDIPVFVNPQDCGGINDGGNYTHGWVKLENDWIKDNHISISDKANPISKIAWQFVKQNYPQILYGFDNDPSLSGDEALDNIINILSPAAAAFKSLANTNPYKQLRDLGVGQTVDLSKSYIRLYEPTANKFGGTGARVKLITVTDDWQNMAGNPQLSSSYSVKYEYTKTENGKQISSGVVAYEPDKGAEENPWKQPIFFKEKNLLMPDDNNFLTGPFGESLFPSASIIYSKVKTTQNPVISANQQGTGYSLNEFYTARDFPTRLENTEIQLKRTPKIGISIQNTHSEDMMVSSQGYQVITNDMHGKPKHEEIVGEAGNVISSKSYYFKSNANTLENQVNAVNQMGEIVNNKLLGIETQICGDTRNFVTDVFSGSVHFNLDIQLPLGLIPTAFPDISFEHKDFSSFTLSKHIRQQGILDSVVVTDKGSTIATKNLLWDLKTGAVLLTQTTNEFKDPIYNFTYPAHWAYSGMGMASDNIGTTVPNVSFNGTPNLSPNLSGLNPTIFQEGDILSLTPNIFSGGNPLRLVVEDINPLKVRRLYQSSATCMGCNLKIITSGKKNLPTVAIGSIVSLDNPIVGSNLVINSATKVIDDNVVVYANPIDECLNCPRVTSSGGQNYQTSILTSTKNLGSWQPVATYKFVGDRLQTIPNPNLRVDGSIKDFTSFWKQLPAASSKWYGFTSMNTAAGTGWIASETVSLVDAESQPIQSINAINVSSNVQFSNFDGMVNATTANAKFHETLFDSFEDYDPNCPIKNHNTIMPANAPNLRTKEQAHTGNYSLKTSGSGLLVQTNPYRPTGCPDIPTYGVSNTPEANLGKETSPKCNCREPFSLESNMKYVLSAWVHESAFTENTIDYANAQIKITSGSTIIAIAKPTGQILDGWQRIETEFTTTGTGVTGFTFSPNTYFDDVRIHPAAANMKSYVYSDRDYKLMATLDENNFATFYEYDNQEQLKRVKKETEKSVVTLQEVNFGSSKK